MPWNAPKGTLSEDALQIQCVTWFRAQYPKHGLRLFAVPNGGSRHVIEAVKLKRSGTLPGVTDLILTIPKKGYGGMFIELKIGNNSLSASQEKFIKAHEKDYYCVVCYALDEFMKEVTNYLKA